MADQATTTAVSPCGATGGTTGEGGVRQGALRG